MTIQYGASALYAALGNRHTLIILDVILMAFARQQWLRERASPQTHMNVIGWKYMYFPLDF